MSHLDLKYNEIEEIDALSNMKQLQDLYLRSNNIKSIEPLDGLKKIETLDVAKNPLKSIKPIMNSGDLSWVNAPPDSFRIRLQGVWLRAKGVEVRFI